MDRCSYNHGSVPMVQRLELQIRKQIYFSDKSVFQYVFGWHDRNRYLFATRRRLYSVSAENPTHYTTLAFRMAYNYSNCLINYLGRGDTEILLPEKVNL